MAATLGSPGPITGPGVDSGIYRSTDGGKTWKVPNCGFENAQVISIRIDPNNPDVAIAVLEGGAPSFTGQGSDKYYPSVLYCTEDGGENWARVEGIDGTERNGYWVMRVVPDDPTQLVTFGLGYKDLSVNVGFMRGTNTGQEWKLVGPEMRHRHIANLDISADERDIFSGWVSKDGGRTWSETPNIQVNGPIAVSPVDSNLVVLGRITNCGD